jgi:hypothetical protein
VRRVLRMAVLGLVRCSRRCWGSVAQTELHASADFVIVEGNIWLVTSTAVRVWKSTTAARSMVRGGAVEFAFPGGVFGDITHPQQVRLGAEEVPVHQVLAEHLDFRVFHVRCRGIPANSALCISLATVYG